MALSFATGNLHLTNWGFSVGDIATLAGAGRAVGTWLVAQIKDRALLDFLSLDIDAVFSRRGLVDLTALHARWDTKLRLLRNNAPVVIAHPRGDVHAVVDNMDRFTWIMTILVAALDAALGSAAVERTLADFLRAAFEESPVGTEYLRRELTQHVQGWRSAACVRGLHSKAKEVWAVLEGKRLHWPGFMPAGDERELLVLLKWLTMGDTTDREFKTGSSDVLCISVVLQDLGMEIRAVNEDVVIEEHLLRVTLSRDLAVRHQGRENEDRRWGMRIPLDFMEECVSIWPGDLGSNNRLRDIFTDGKSMVEKDGAGIRFVSGGSVTTYRVHSRYTPAEQTRLTRVASRAATMFLPNHCYESSRYLGQLTRTWEPEECARFEAYLRDDPTSEKVKTLGSILSSHAISQLQVFLMGFYYHLFSGILDTSLLNLREAYGCWSYVDGEFLTRVAFLMKSNTGSNKWTTLDRPSVISMLAYMFAGAKTAGIEVSLSSTAVGILAKLSILTASCLGRATDMAECGKMVLLDVDTSCIPCNSRGVVVEGVRPASPLVRTLQGNHEVQDAAGLWLSDDSEDFTPHIEPDWQNDLQGSLITFRHHGRLVATLTPSMLEHAIEVIQMNGLGVNGSTAPDWMSEPRLIYEVQKRDLSIIRVPLQTFHGGHVVLPGNEDTSILIPTLNLPKARACILAMYEAHKEVARSRARLIEFSEASCSDDITRVLARNARFIIGSEHIKRRMLEKVNLPAAKLKALERDLLEGEVRDERIHGVIDRERALRQPTQPRRRPSL